MQRKKKELNHERKKLVELQKDQVRESIQKGKEFERRELSSVKNQQYNNKLKNYWDNHKFSVDCKDKFIHDKYKLNTNLLDQKRLEQRNILDDKIRLKENQSIKNIASRNMLLEADHKRYQDTAEYKI